MKQHSSRTDYDTELKAITAYLFVGPFRKYRIEDIAKKLNMEYIDFYPYAAGKRTMPVELIVKITDATGDMIFFDTIFRGTKYHCEGNVLHPHTNNLYREAFEAFESSGEISGALKQAIADGKLSQQERLKLETKVAKAIEELRDMFDILKSSFDSPASGTGAQDRRQ